MNSLTLEYQNESIKNKILLFLNTFLANDVRIIENRNYTYENDIGETIKVENGNETIIPTKNEIAELKSLSKNKDDFISFDKIDWS